MFWRHKQHPLRTELVKEWERADAAEERARQAEARLVQLKQKRTIYCSFCCKSEDQVRTLVAGTSVFICDQCIEVAQQVVETAQTVQFHHHSGGTA